MIEKNCVVCSELFEKKTRKHKVCGEGCAIAWAIDRATKREDKAHALKKRDLKRGTLSYQLNLTQKICNKYIKLRDADEPCISCGKNGSDFPYHAGHYVASGRSSILRFDARNIHKQCLACNVHLRGNLINYRASLLKKIGEAEVLFLEQERPAFQFTIEYLLTLQEEFKQKIKAIS